MGFVVRLIRTPSISDDQIDKIPIMKCRSCMKSTPIFTVTNDGTHILSEICDDCQIYYSECKNDQERSVSITKN